MARPQPEPEKRIGILTGWRCWTVLREEGLLRPIWKRGLIWKPRQPFEALCAGDDTKFPNRVAVHPVPDKACHCGLWAVCHPMLLQEVAWDWKADETLVVGQVALWGRVIEFERGWRAQFGYPTHLYALTDDELLAQTLRERYQVPVAGGAAAWALERILPPNLRAPGRADREPSADEEMPAVPFALAGVVEMVQSTEFTQLERLREDLRAAQHKLEDSRALLRIERERLRLDRENRRIDLERMRLEVERAAVEAGPAQPSATRRRGRAPDPASVERAATIKARLIEAGISQDTLARAAVVTRSYVCHALSGRHRAARVMACALELLRQAGAPKKRAK